MYSQTVDGDASVPTRVRVALLDEFHEADELDHGGRCVLLWTPRQKFKMVDGARLLRLRTEGVKHGVIVAGCNGSIVDVPSLVYLSRSHILCVFQRCSSFQSCNLLQSCYVFQTLL